MKNKTFRILANGESVCNDTWITGLNNNDLIIGPSGAGKTRNYVKPNIMQCNESIVVADTKGSLYHEVGDFLKNNGYDVRLVDFKDVRNSCGYNPFDYIRYDNERNAYVSQDIITFAKALVPESDISQKEPFWDKAAQLYLESLISYVLECLPEEEHSPEYIYKLYSQMRNGNFEKLIKEWEYLQPDSFAAQTYHLFENNKTAEKMDCSILGILAEKLNGLIFPELIESYHNENRINFKELGKKKTAIFLNISDTDRSMDRLVNLFYTQGLQALCNSADNDYPDHRLPVPVRFILDDFAANVVIPDFDQITSIIRSREISVSIILQSITQLEGLYGYAKATTIINNCDNWLYLGGQDISTANIISQKANKTKNTILDMPLDKVYLFTRGASAKMVDKYNLKEHPRYCELPEAQRESAAEAAADTVIEEFSR